MEIVYFIIVIILCCIIVFQESKIRILESTIDEIVKAAKEGMTKITDQSNKSMEHMIKFTSDAHIKIINEMINKNGK